MNANASYPDLFKMGEEAFVRFRAEFARYGIETDANLGLHRSQGTLCYYDFSDRQIYLSVPDLSASTGKLMLMFFRQTLCAQTNEELFRFLTIFIPFIVAHEMAHHFRHRNGLFGNDSWHEEQVANQLAAAVNKHRLTPAERAFAAAFLERAMKKLGADLGLGESAVESYHDIAHALEASNRLSAAEMNNFRLVQGVAPNPSASDTALRESGVIGVNSSLQFEKRDALISNFNQEYATDSTRYIYYQVGWVYLAMKSTQAHYVDEFARVHLNRAPSYLPIPAPSNVSRSAICALYDASRVAGAHSSTLSRYFYKRYRGHLLKYIEQTQATIGSAAGDDRRINFDVLTIWDDHNHDPLNFLAGMVPQSYRDLFPVAMQRRQPTPTTCDPNDLPTMTDQRLWSLTCDAATHRAENDPIDLTTKLFEQFDRLELFRPLPPEVLIELGKKSYLARYHVGETVVWHGDFNNDIFILLEGQLEICTQEQSKIADIAPGELFGEIAWLTRGSRAASVRAITEAECLVITESDLQILAYQSPSILQSIAATLARRLRSYL